MSFIRPSIRVKHLLKYQLLTFISLFTSTTACAELDRPSLITESFFASRENQRLFDGRNTNHYSYKNQSAMLWHKALLGMGINNPAPDSHARYSLCHYDTALSVLNKLRQEGASVLYQKIWATNQNHVFSACSQRSLTHIPPLEPEMAQLPERAQSDFDYQMASWYFYELDYEKALPIYQQLANNISAPSRPYANYMVVRTLSYLELKGEAYQKITDILADASLSSIHDITANYRFIIMYNAYRGERSYNSIAQDHLEWLLEKITVNPEQAENITQAFQIYFDARQQLDQYFPLYDKNSMSVDWWLKDTVPTSPRMKAVHTLASQNETVDWLQASWSYNIFDYDWLWALHAKDHRYWEQNKHIVDHAWERWQTGDGLEWLEIVMKRIHPNSPHAHNAVAQAQLYIERDWHDESHEYRQWLYNIWLHSLRISLAHQDINTVIDLVKKQSDFGALISNEYSSTENQRHRYNLDNIERWLIYTGQTSTARQVLSILSGFYPKAFSHWQTLLATNWQEAMISATTSSQRPYSYVGRNSALWQRMLNILPTSELYKIATQSNIHKQFKPELSRAILTRGMLLKQHNEIDNYALLATKHHPKYRQDILSAVEQHKSKNYVQFILRTPRMRPVPFTDSWGIFKGSISEIDTYNHNDNNWWCAFDFEYQQQQIFDAASIKPNDLHPTTALLNTKGLKEEIQAYLNKQRDFLAQHPYNSLIDHDEINALAAIPSGPKYLTEAVINYTNDESWFSTEDDSTKNQHAADLHYAIRTTRYGCQKNGSHGIYSQTAYQTLKTKYRGLIWEKATPYWFGDQHFRWLYRPKKVRK